MKVEKGIEEILDRLTELERRIDAIGNIVYDELVVKSIRDEGFKRKNNVKWKKDRDKLVKDDKTKGKKKEDLQPKINGE